MKTETYSFACEKACRSLQDADGRELWTLTLSADQLPTEFKLGPNARHATKDKPLVKRMLKTLESEPEKFVLYNGGIMVVAQSISVSKDQVTLKCIVPEEDEDFPGHGVLNGGHSYLALCEALTSPDKRYAAVGELASVMLTVCIGIDDEEISDISRARNTSEKVPEYALRELKGDWKLLKDNIPPATRPFVETKPGDPIAEDAHYDMTDLLKRISLLNTDLFPAQAGVHPIQAYTSIGSLVKKYTPERFQKYAHLLGDVIWLEEQIRREHEAQNGKQKTGKSRKIGKVNGCGPKEELLLSGYVSSLTVAVPFTFPVIAAFRVFLTSDGTWYRPIKELWDEWGPKLVENLWDYYQAEGKSSAASFGRSKATWTNICQPTLLSAVRDQVVTDGFK